MPWSDIHTATLAVGDAEPVGPQPAVPVPTGGGVVDVEARAALAEVLRVLEVFGLVLPASSAPPPPAPAADGSGEEVPPRPPRRSRQAGES